MTIIALSDYQPRKVPHKRPYHDKFVETTRDLLHDPRVIAARDAAIGPWLADEVDQELRGFDPRHMGMI